MNMKMNMSFSGIYKIRLTKARVIPETYFAIALSNIRCSGVEKYSGITIANFSNHNSIAVVLEIPSRV